MSKLRPITGRPGPVKPYPHPDNPVMPSIPAALVPEHSAIVMDGNGRWANQRGLPRTEGTLGGA